MLGKRKARKTRKAVAVRPVARRKLSLTKAVEMSAEEVASLELVAARHQHSEQAWLSMTAPPEEDRWSSVEEHLLAKPHERDHSLRRWKYFSK